MSAKGRLEPLGYDTGQLDPHQVHVRVRLRDLSHRRRNGRQQLRIYPVPVGAWTLVYRFIKTVTYLVRQISSIGGLPALD